MCGRYYLKITIDKLIKKYGIFDGEIDYTPADEIFPSDQVPVVIQEKNKEKKIKLFKWGFNPGFTRGLIINARGETVDKKPIFKNCFMQKRCLVPASGFFEWKDIGKRKIKYRISLKDKNVFSLAGIFDTFKDKDGNNIQSFTIITTNPNDKLKNIHNRMPVILQQKDETYWLDNNFSDTDTLKNMLKPYSSLSTIVKPDTDQLKLSLFERNEVK